MIRCADESESGSPRISRSALIPVRSEKLSTSRWRISPSGREMTLFVSREWAISRSCRSSSTTAREVVEAAVCLLAVVLEDERIDLLLQQLHVGGERQHVLDGAVVEVEAEAHQPAFGRGDERALSGRGVLEQVLPLGSAERRGALEEVRLGDGLLHGADPAHDRGIRLAEAEHRR